MRRTDREIKNPDDIFPIIERCEVVHLAMTDGEKPYVVALNFGFDRQGDGLILYLHSAQEGRKIDLLKKNPSVCFQMDCAGRLVKGTPENPCSYSWKFCSVMGSGQVEFITDETQKKHALSRILQHLDRTETCFDFPPQAVSKTCVYRVVSHDITGKRHM